MVTQTVYPHIYAEHTYSAILDVEFLLADLMSTKNEADQAGQQYKQQNATTNSNAYNSSCTLLEGTVLYRVGRWLCVVKGFLASLENHIYR